MLVKSSEFLRIVSTLGKFYQDHWVIQQRSGQTIPFLHLESEQKFNSAKTYCELYEDIPSKN